jgi:hypothetical protein
VSTIQPLPARAAITTSRPKDTRGPALVALWCQLAVKAAEAEAHDLPSGASLLRQQLLVEEQISTHPEWDARMQVLLCWEASLLHTAEGDPSSCLQCRRARLTLPPECPVPPAQKRVRR